MSLPPCVIVHDLDGARAALAPGLPVTLLSATGAGVFAGVGWWRALLTACGHTGPDLLDCGDAPGRALAALRAGQTRLVLRAPAAIRADIAARGALVLAAPPAALDLGQPGAARNLQAWLTQT